MDYDIIGKIYQSIFDKMNEYKYNNKEKIFDNKASAVISTIVANAQNKEFSEDEIPKYIKNLEDFCKEKKNIETLEMMGRESANIYLSFIAYGQSKSKEKHKESMIDFAADQIKHEMILDDQNYEDLEDLQKIEYQKLLHKFIKEYIEGETENLSASDYSLSIKKISSIIKAKHKIAQLLLNLMEKNNLHQEMQQNMQKNNKRSIIATILGGAIGFGIAAIGGLKLIDMFIPISFGLGAGFISKNLSGLYAKFSGSETRFNPYMLLNSKIAEIRRGVSDIIKIQDRDSSRKVEDLSFEALQELKNINIPQIDMNQQNDVKEIADIRTHVEKALSNNKGNIEQGK